MDILDYLFLKLLPNYLKEKFKMNDWRANPYFSDWNKEYGGGDS